MSAAIAITQLSNLVRDLDYWIPGLNDVTCTKEELSALDVLGAKLADAATIVQKKTGSFRLPLEEQAWRASEKLRSQAQSTIISLTKSVKLERPVVFRRNIAMIFTGPKDSEFDSNDVKSRKAVTRQRCERIRKLNPDGVVAWAASYTPTSWAAGCMGKDIFDCLIDDIEPDSAQSWPPVIQETVQKLRTEEETLQSSVEYGEFIHAILDPSCRSQAPHGHRKRSNNDNQTSIREQMATSSQEPIGRIATWNPAPDSSSQSLFERSFNNGNQPFMPIFYLPLEFYKYSGLLTSQLQNICGPYLSNAMKTSYLWDGGAATHCFGVAFPSNPYQDAIVVMSISQVAGTQLLQFIDSMPPMPSLHGPHIQQEH